MRKVIHLLPYDGIGGAEVAARSMASASDPHLDFELRYIFPLVGSGTQRATTFNPLKLLSAAWEVRRAGPDLLIVSLWRSCTVGILVRLLRPRTRMVVMIHNSVDAHFLDFLFTRWAIALSQAIWADSGASIRLRFRRPPRVPVTLIPFLTQRLEAIAPPGDAPPPTFIFWGRLAPQKNLPAALELFHRILQARPEARLTLIGPDSGELAFLQASCQDRGMAHAVRFEGPLSFGHILRLVPGHAFYLQTSWYEGMAMSVVEAMQLGLVPVVTPVGEVGAYCRAGHNAVIVDDARTPASAVAEVLRLLGNPAAYQALRHNAIETWRGKPLYGEAVMTECRRLMGAEPAGVPRGSSRDVD